MTLAITPTSATNKLLVTVVANVAQSDAGGAYVVGALFQDSTASALNASEVYINGTGQNKQLVLSHYMTSGTTSSTTFKFRAGPHLAASVYFNGNGGGRLLGGVYISSITITEIKA